MKITQLRGVCSVLSYVTKHHGRNIYGGGGCQFREPQVCSGSYKEVGYAPFVRDPASDISVVQKVAQLL
jgi:hypothetical protein